MKLRYLAPVFVAASAMILLSCGQAGQQEVQATAERVENPALAIAVATVPQAFTLHENTGDQLRFRAAGPTADGLLSFSTGPVETAGINLIDAVEYRKATFAELPDGRYFGNLELGTPMGTAFTARGAYSADGEAVEEIWVYAIHPSANRLLTLTYTYPEGESKERMGHLVEILGEIEGLESDEPIRIES